MKNPDDLRRQFGSRLFGSRFSSRRAPRPRAELLCSGPNKFSASLIRELLLGALGAPAGALALPPGAVVGVLLRRLDGPRVRPGF